MAHLSDLFKVGKLAPIVYPGMDDVEIWVTRPNSPQQDLVKKKSRSAKARRQLELAADAEEGIAIRLEVNDMKKPDVVDSLLTRKVGEYRQQAFNEVLFSKDHGSDWGEEGDEYLSVISAIIERADEIESYNKELRAATPEGEEAAGLIDVFEDEELTKLNAIQEKFSEETTARSAELIEQERIELSSLTLSELRETLIKERIELECDVEWMVTRRYGMLFYACRYPDDHSKLYFKEVADIQALPQLVQEQLFTAYEDTELGVEDVKNSLTPLPS